MRNIRLTGISPYVISILRRKFFVKDEVDHYLGYLKDEKNYAETTIDGYSQDLWAFYRFLNKNKKGETVLSQITKEEILEFLKSSEKVEKIAASTRNRRLSVLKLFYRYCIEKKVVKEDLTLGIERAKIIIDDLDFLTYEDYERMVAYIEQKETSDFYKLRDIAIIATLYNTGIRLRELTSLNIENIDFEIREIRNMLRKGGKRVNLVINNDVLKKIQKWLIYREKNKVSLHEEALFLSDHKQRIHHRTVQFMVSKYARKSGITKKVTPHMFRHSFCSEIQNRGASMWTAKELLNHSSISTTSRYSHTNKEAMRKAVDSLEKPETPDKKKK